MGDFGFPITYLRGYILGAVPRLREAILNLHHLHREPVFRQPGINLFLISKWEGSLELPKVLLPGIS